MTDNPCRLCVHYEHCNTGKQCNSFVSIAEEYFDGVDRRIAEQEYIEYTEAFIDYIDPDKD